jgi:hypothetical protein
MPDKENAKHFTGTKKCGGEKNRIKGVPAPSAHQTAVFRSPSERQRAKRLASVKRRTVI